LKAGAICVAFLRISRSRPASIWGMEQVAMRRTAGTRSEVGIGLARFNANVLIWH